MSIKVKKILTIVVLILMSILAINTKVKAKSIGYDRTQVTAAAYEAENWHLADVVDGAPGNNTFCVYVKEDLIPHSTYNVVNYIYIDGKTSYIYENNKNTHANRADHGLLATHTASENVSMAWILNQADPGGHPYQNIYSDKQLAVYGYFDTWLRANGLVFTHRNTDSSGNTYTNEAWIQQARNYANAYENSGKASITNNTKQENIKVESYQYNGDDYIKVGPLNFSYSQTITGMAVYDQDDKQISAKYGRYEGTNLKVADNPAEIIISGQDFYVLVKEDGNTSRINKIDASVQAVKEKLMAEIWTLSRNNGVGNQNLITTNAWKEQEPDNITVNILPQPVDLIGDLYVVKVNEGDHEIRLPNVGFIFQRKNNGTYVVQDENGKISYTENRDDATEFFTDENGEIHIEKLIIGDYIAYETKNPNYGYEFPTDGQPIKIEVEKNNPDLLPNPQVYIKLSGYVWEDKVYGKQSIKNDLYKDPDTVDPETGDQIDLNDLRVPGITVNLINRDTNTVEKTTVTDDNGEYQFVDVEVEKVRNDKYYVEFVYNGITYTNVVPECRDNEKEYKNYLKLNNSSKAEEGDATREAFNSKFATIEGNDSNASQAVVKYQYGDVNYDGNLTEEDAKMVLNYSVKNIELNDFQKVAADVNKDGQINASDAQAILIAIENGSSLGETGIVSSTGRAIGTEGEISNLVYANDEAQVSKDTAYKSTLVNGDQFTINAITDNTGYKIKDDFKWGIEEIKWINLGLDRRDQPDLALQKDISNVKLAINGKQHVYIYENRFRNQGDYDGRFNVGVKFANEYGKEAYTRPIYKSDYQFTTEDGSKELEVYITYAIAMRNEATNLTSQVNRLVDYYDKNYDVVAVGTEKDDSTGTVTNNIGYQGEAYNDTYNKMTINSNTKIDAQNDSTIYVQFKLNRQKVIDILNNKELLENVVEIDSYSTFKDGAIYAGIDLDSNPGNAIPNDTKTHQDDTDTAPALKLEVADARKMMGTVFEDNAVAPTNGGTGNQRQGNGTYDEGEHGIGGVNVTFKQIGTGVTYITNSVTEAGKYGFEMKDQDGNDVSGLNEIPDGSVITITPKKDSGDVELNVGDFYIPSYVPGDYEMIYTWGGQEYNGTKYTVQNYKATIYDQERYSENYEKGNALWYKGENKNNPDTRYSDAIDDYNNRLDIDGEMTSKTYNTATTIEKMDSTSAKMSIEVEYSSNVTTAEKEDKLEYTIKNIDFGIIQRPIQSIELNKRVASMKVTLANGQTIVDAQIDENGNMTGQTDGLVHMPASPSTNPSNGFIRLELDNELIQGAKLEVTYTIKATNISEVDYKDENYYKLGILPSNTQDTIMKLVPSEVVDYLDKEWGFDETINSDWRVITIDELKNMVAEEVYTVGDNSESTINDKIILHTTALAKELDPINNKSASVNLNCSKLLSNSDEISFDNETEITKVDKPNGGSDIPSTPGNYVPGTGHQEPDDSTSETVIITPNTGDNMNFIVPIATGIIALVVLGVGVFLIKRKVIDKK